MAINWGNFTLNEILSKNYPPEFWIWAGWNDRGRNLPRPKQVQAWINKNGAIPKSWYLRYYAHKGLRPPLHPSIPTQSPQTPSQPLAELYRHAMLCAEDPLSANAVKSHYTFWLSADPAYDPGLSVVRTLKDKRRVGAWCNPAQISKETLDQFCEKYDIPNEMRMGQSENENEFDKSVQYGLKVTVGQISSLRPSQKWLIQANKVFHLEEDYWNVQPWLTLNFENLPVVATIKGTYDGKSDSPTYGRYLGPQDYINANRWDQYAGAYHAAGPRNAQHQEDYLDFP